MQVTAQSLRLIAPKAASNVDAIVAALNPAMKRFGINTQRRAAHFIGQLVHESGQFTRTRESFNYTPEGILRTFCAKVKRFTMEEANRYGRTGQWPANQEAIANIAYANRMGNGDVTSGDGWRHRGAGWIQLTGKAQQVECADVFDLHPSVVMQWLCTPAGAALSAAWFWQKNNLSTLADLDDVDAVSDVINIGRRTEREGDAIGYRDRVFLTELCKRELP